jgi:dolichol kinase
LEDKKMKKGFTELVFILDKSGSMAGLEGDTIGGYNSVLKKQKALEGDAAVTTVLFNNHYQLLHDRIVPLLVS